MSREISPELFALQLEQADAFQRDAAARIGDMHAPDFYRWVADRQLDDAKKFAHAARMERDAKQAAAELEKALKQAINDNRNDCDCVHCEPHRLAIHGNGCGGHHCTGSCLSQPLNRCGRCQTPVTPLAVVVTGPHRTCQPCADIIRN